MKIEVKKLHDEVATLTAAIEAAIEEAIKNGQKSIEGCNNTLGSDQVSNNDVARTGTDLDPKVVGWVDDF